MTLNHCYTYCWSKKPLFTTQFPVGRSFNVKRDHSQDDWYIHDVEIHL